MARGVKFIRWDPAELIEQVRSVCRVDENGCWIWEYGGFDREWYPEITIKGRGQAVSRWVLEVKTGVSDEIARHTCDRMPCCNPDHLLWGTQADNIRDAIERGRHVSCKHLPVAAGQSGKSHWTQRFPEKIKRGQDNPLFGRARPDLSGELNGAHTQPESRPHGEGHGRSKLTVDQVREIRKLHESGTSVYRLSKEYGMSKHAIKMIIRRETWRHV